MKLSTLKPLHANWMVQAFDRLRENRDALQFGWTQSGIAGAVSHKYD